MKPLHQNGLSYLMKNYNTVLIDYSKTQPISYLASILTSLINNYDNKVSYNLIKMTYYKVKY